MSLFSFYDVIVSQDGEGDFSSVRQALEHAPQDSSEYVIFIRKGIYQESFEINRPRVVLVGEDRDRTIITASVANGMIDSSGRKFATFGSRTISVNAPDFSARTLTIENGFDFPGNQKKSDGDPTKLTHTQAVALLVAHRGDRVHLHNIRLVSYHDTLYLYAGRTYIHQSFITGTVDFIFGGGTALFEDCQIVARNRDDVSSDEPYGYLVAPCTSIDQEFGFVFKGCCLSREERVPDGSYGLGRPWHPTTQFDDGHYADPDAVGHAAFLCCDVDKHLYGWDKMGGRNKNQETIWFYPEDSRFWEYGNTGPGVVSDKGRPQLSPDQMKRYTADTILSGWHPESQAEDQYVLQGTVSLPDLSFPAHVVVTDSCGKTTKVLTDSEGRYLLSVQGMFPPFLATVRQNDQSCCIRAFVAYANSGIMTVDINADTESQIANYEALTRCSLAAEKPVAPVSRQLWK